MIRFIDFGLTFVEIDAVCWNSPEAVELFLARGADPTETIIVNKVEVKWKPKKMMMFIC